MRGNITCACSSNRGRCHQPQLSGLFEGDSLHLQWVTQIVAISWSGCILALTCAAFALLLKRLNIPAHCCERPCILVGITSKKFSLPALLDVLLKLPCERLASFPKSGPAIPISQWRKLCAYNSGLVRVCWRFSRFLGHFCSRARHTHDSLPRRSSLRMDHSPHRRRLRAGLCEAFVPTVQVDFREGVSSPSILFSC